MKITFIAEIEATIPGSNVKFTKRLETEKASKLLEALSFTNGTANGIPTLEKLLNHLFEERAAYCERNYVIFVKYGEVANG